MALDKRDDPIEEEGLAGWVRIGCGVLAAVFAPLWLLGTATLVQLSPDLGATEVAMGDGVVVIMGSTFDGRYEPVEEVAKALDDHEAKTGQDIPIHVDGASGGFVAPFLQPEIKWDFRLPRVKSINASGHKYGLVYPGVGWVIFRDKEALPEELIFHVKYLGGDMLDLSINFSRPGNRVVAQYYNFLSLGHSGYKRVMSSLRECAMWLSGEMTHRPSSTGRYFASTSQ